MRELTKDESDRLRTLQSERAAVFKSLGVIQGLAANGVEGRHVAAVEAEYDYRESLGESGIMRGKAKYQRR